MNETAREWLEKAQGDFDAVEMLMGSGRETIYDAVGFHCQQCIEKMLKAALMLAEHKPPKTHDLITLGRLLNAERSDWQPNEESLQLLTRFAVDARYPGYKAMRAQAEEAFRLCEMIRQSLLPFVRQ